MSDALVPGVTATCWRGSRPRYWRIGRLILSRQENEPWGSGVINRLAGDLRRGNKLL